MLYKKPLLSSTGEVGNERGALLGVHSFVNQLHSNSQWAQQSLEYPIASAASRFR